MMVLIDVFGKGGLTAIEYDTPSDRPRGGGSSGSSSLGPPLLSRIIPLSVRSASMSYPGIDQRRYSEKISMASRRSSHVFICAM